MRQPGCDWMTAPGFLMPPSAARPSTLLGPKACSGHGYYLSFLGFSKAAFTLAVAAAMVAADTINGQNEVIWTHSNGTMAEWNVDTNWNYQSHNIYSAGSNSFLATESSFNMDFNNDSVIGDPLA